MERGPGSGTDVQTLLAAIKSAELVESRIQLLTDLGDVSLTGNSDLASVLECLIALWEDFTCLDVSQCTLNNSILRVAVNCLKVETEACRKLFFILGAKACAWGRKHLKMTLMSTGESQEEEHSGIFFQLLLELFNFSAACYSVIATNRIFIDKMQWDAIESFTLHQLDLLRDLIAEIKSIQSLGSELLKVSQLVLEAATKACRVYAESVNWDSYDAKPESAENNLISVDADHLKCVINLMKCTIEKMCIMGTLAANGGGSLVCILNSSWKGVVSLLQLGKGTLADNVNIDSIIKTLVSLATESLQCGAQSWCTLGEIVSVGEAKRVFLPIKFFLINAVRISTRYPCQAILVHREIARCILVASTFAVLVSQDAFFRNVAEALEEHLKPSVLHLLKSLLNAAEREGKLKSVFDCLFCSENDAIAENTDDVIAFPVALLEKALSMTSEALPGTRILLLGRVALFIDVMKASPELEENLMRVICGKLQWLLEMVVDEMIYSSILVLQVSGLNRHGKISTILWQPIHSNLLHALKTFMIVASSSSFWADFEFFLLENFLHTHFLCHEIVMELWSFMARHAEEGLINNMSDKLYSLYQLVWSSDSRLLPDSTPRKVARSICRLLSCSKPALADRFYTFVDAEQRPHLSALMWAAMLLEGFNLNLLSSNVRSKALERSVKSYLQLIGLFTDASMNTVELRVLILSSILQSLQVSVPEIDRRTLKFLITVLCRYKNSEDSSTRNQCGRLISDTLQIISTSKQLYKLNDMEQIIFELRDMFCSAPTKGTFPSHKCKSSLTLFMASLGHMEIEECEGNSKSTCVWELYHLLLRERDWALVHHVITSFGYFAARTSCNQLWRFVPKDAALSFDVESGNDPNEERFMSELKTFLVKETALTSAKASAEQIRLTMREGLILKELHTKSMNIDSGPVGCEIMEISGENPSSKRRKLPDGFSHGMEMLQSGLKLMGDGLSQQGHNFQDLVELRSKISLHFSQLKEMIDHLAGSVGGG